jgi:hypothetical protein
MCGGMGREGKIGRMLDTLAPAMIPDMADVALNVLSMVIWEHDWTEVFNCACPGRGVHWIEDELECTSVRRV